MNKATYSMIISLIRQLIILVPVSYILDTLFGLNHLWFAF